MDSLPDPDFEPRKCHRLSNVIDPCPQSSILLLVFSTSSKQWQKAALSHFCAQWRAAVGVIAELTLQTAHEFEASTQQRLYSEEISLF